MGFNLYLCVVFLLGCTFANCNLYANDQGNFTDTQIALIQNIIGAGEDEHGADDLDGVASLIAEFLTKAYKKCWNVYVFDQTTLNGTFSAHIQDNKWLKWINYGRLNLSYLITKDSSVYNNSKIGAQNPTTGQSFGHDLQQKDQEFITNLLTEAVVFKGDNLDVNAQFIRSKLYPGNWNVYITDGSKSFGGSECRKGQHWARIEHFGRFKWNYYVTRSY